jgi:hypothetical protein
MINEIPVKAKLVLVLNLMEIKFFGDAGRSLA